MELSYRLSRARIVNLRSDFSWGLPISYNAGQSEMSFLILSSLSLLMEFSYRLSRVRIPNLKSDFFMRPSNWLGSRSIRKELFYFKLSEPFDGTLL